VASTIVVAAENPFIGTWKIDEAKSSSNYGSLARETRTYEPAEGETMRVTISGSGAPGTLVLSIRPDGQQRKANATSELSRLTGLTTVIQRRPDARTLASTFQDAAGREVAVTRTQISADGRTLTVSTTGTAMDGRKLRRVAVYQKQ
jgi:hypothetical protein